MAVSTEYLDKIGFATVRREPGDTSDAAMDSLIEDAIESAREDMILKGVAAEVAEDESDMRTRGCIQSFVRWQIQPTSASKDLEEYQLQLDDLRKNMVTA